MKLQPKGEICCDKPNIKVYKNAYQIEYRSRMHNAESSFSFFNMFIYSNLNRFSQINRIIKNLT